jgi:hypothetical protein
MGVCVHKVARLFVSRYWMFDSGQAVEPQDLKPVTPKLMNRHDLLPFNALTVFQLTSPQCFR